MSVIAKKVQRLSNTSMKEEMPHSEVSRVARKHMAVDTCSPLAKHMTFYMR